MKTPIFQKPRLIIIALTTLALAAGNVLAQDSSSSTSTATKDAAVQPADTHTSQAPPKLSYGVPEVLALSKAKVSDGTIINYIRNSGNNYGLNAAQIIYLRRQGVSSAVVNAMLDQRLQTAQKTSTTPTTPVSQPVNSTTYNTEISTAAAQPTVTYVETVPSSSVYIIPDTQTYRYNNWFYYHRPFYSYSAYCWPRRTVSVCDIGSRGWVGYRGGYHSGWRSGGFHGRSFHSGGWHHR